MKRNCSTCKWNIKEDCNHTQSIKNCPLPSYPLWEEKDKKKNQDSKVMYTEKEVKEVFKWLGDKDYLSDDYNVIYKEWFEQHKKK